MTTRNFEKALVASVSGASGYTDAAFQFFSGNIFEGLSSIEISKFGHPNDHSKIGSSVVFEILCQRFCSQLAGSFSLRKYI